MPPQFTERQKWEFIARGILSILIVGAGLFIIFNGSAFSDATAKWAFSSIGVVIGYWLR